MVFEVMLKPGGIHLVEEGLPMAFRLYRSAPEKKSEGLCISTEHPRSIESEREISSGELVWLSEKENEESISPKNLEGLRDRITEFADTHGRDGVIILDGLEYLSTSNGFDRTLSFLHDIREKIALTETRIIVPISPRAYEEKQLARLKRYSEVMETIE